MQTLEEKRKEIEELCQNLNKDEVADVQYSIFNKIITIIFKRGALVRFKISDDVYYKEDDEYKELIEILENYQQPELYTLDEIDRVGKKWIEERHTIKEPTSVFDYLKNNIKPYKEQS